MFNTSRHVYQLRMGLTRRDDRRAALLRAAMALLYAHWEGFIKTAGTAYVEFVAAQRLRLDELAPNFLALASRRALMAATGARRIHAHIELTKLFRCGLHEVSSMPHQHAVNTRANLSSEALRDVMDTLGLDYSPFATKGQLIDETLLASRNTIAHGEYLTITESTYRDTHKEVLRMMETFRTLVQNAANSGGYRGPTPATSG